MKTLQDLKNMIAEPTSKEWFEKWGLPSCITNRLHTECVAYLDRHGVSMDDVEADDDGVLSFPNYDQDGEYIGEIELPERFNSLFK